MTSPLDGEILPSSFRDPSGFLFKKDGNLYRQINPCYQKDYTLLKASGLYEQLVKNEWLISHEEIPKGTVPENGDSPQNIKPEHLPFISYPYEWSFEQLKDAALLTLEIQKLSIEKGMSLKDASAFNIQFKNAKPILIDTLSFETYKEGEPWVAYRQFCQHFLAPLALMAHVDVRLLQLFRVHMDGIPLDLTSRLLPMRTKFQFSLLTHIHIHAKAQAKYADSKPKPNKPEGTVSKSGDSPRGGMSQFAMLGLIDNLQSAVQKLSWKPEGTEWGDYYADTNYTDTSLDKKKQLVSEMIAQARPKMLWDLGANTGLFSRLASQMGIETIAFDIDPAAVQKNYLDCKKSGEKNLLPLLLDLTNPSPALGWANNEREDFERRARPDMLMALAIIHHLAISNNVPLERVASLFNCLAPYLIIEFVPKSDSQVKRLLSSREDIFPHYTKEGFETAFKQCFEIISEKSNEGTERTLYLMKRN